jgi:hypothetical protein
MTRCREGTYFSYSGHLQSSDVASLGYEFEIQ